MKLLFLDIDGVLITKRSAPNFDEISCANLSDLLHNEPDLRIVISSSRRNVMPTENLFLWLYNNVPCLAARGITGVTPSKFWGGRGAEISAWHAPISPMPYVIFDDKLFSGHGAHLILIDPTRGITALNVAHAQEVLR